MRTLSSPPYTPLHRLLVTSHFRKAEASRHQAPGELNALLEKVRSLESEKSGLLGKIAETQDKQVDMQRGKDHLTQVVSDLSTKRESLLAKIKALKSERGKLQVTFYFKVNVVLKVLFLCACLSLAQVT